MSRGNPVCRGLEKAHRSKALKTLHSFSAGLDALYAHMMEVIRIQEDSDDAVLCIQIDRCLLTP